MPFTAAHAHYYSLYIYESWSSGAGRRGGHPFSLSIFSKRYTVVLWLHVFFKPQRDSSFSQMEMSALKVAEDINAEYWSVSSKSGTFPFTLEFCNLVVSRFVSTVHQKSKSLGLGAGVVY